MQRFDFNYYFSPQIAKVSKYDQYIKEYLLKNSELSIEKIGTFKLGASGGDSRVIHPQFITFQFNKKAQTSEELVDFIVAETGKSKSLVSSDLTSLFDDGRQFANLGKPFMFADLGMVSINRQGEFEFVPGAGNVSVADNSHNIKTPGESAGSGQRGRNAVIFIAFLIIALVAGGIGWGIYKYIYQKRDNTTVETAAIADTANHLGKPADSLATSAQKPENVANTAAGDSAFFKFIFETTTNSYRAHKRYDSLKSWKEPVLLDSVVHDTSTAYHLFIRIRLLPKDTAYVRDSLQRYYARPNPIRIQPN